MVEKSDTASIAQETTSTPKVVCLCCGVDKLDEYIQLDLGKHTGLLLIAGYQYQLVPFFTKDHSEGYVFCSGDCVGKYLSEKRIELLTE